MYPPLHRRSTRCLVTRLHLRTCAHSVRSQRVGNHLWKRFGSFQAQSVHVFGDVARPQRKRERFNVRFKGVPIFSQARVGLNCTHWVKVAEREGAKHSQIPPLISLGSPFDCVCVLACIFSLGKIHICEWRPRICRHSFRRAPCKRSF